MTAAETLATEAAGEQLGWGERLSDRFNPILVREVQQALKGKLFLISLALASVAIVIGALVAIPQWRGQDDDSASPDIPRAVRVDTFFIWC